VYEILFGQFNQIPHKYKHEHDFVTAVIHHSNILNCLKLLTPSDFCSCQFGTSTVCYLAAGIL